MANALQKITRRAKQLRKANPSAHRNWKGFVKAAAKEYKQGSAPKRKVAAIVIREKKESKRARPKRTYVVTRTKKGTYKSYKRVGATGSKTNLLPILGVAAGVGLLAYLFMSRNNQPQYPANYPVYNPTGNVPRDQNAQTILAYATAGGLALDAIARLIESFKSKSDTELKYAVDNIDAGNGIPDYLYA